MHSRSSGKIRSLTLAVRTTVALLSVAAVLLVLGIFNAALQWDLFSPRVEAVLYGLFGSCLALAGIGVAMTFVIGVQEVVAAFRRLQVSAEPVAEASRGAYAKVILSSLIGLLALVTLCGTLNALVLRHRQQVFEQVAREQLEIFGPRLAGLVGELGGPPRARVPEALYQIIRSLDNLSFIQRSTVYLPDPDEPSALWGYTAWREYRTEDGFARFYAAKEFEKGMAASFTGSTKDLERLNHARDFTVFYPLHNEIQQLIGILRIDGNPRENFREYSL